MKVQKQILPYLIPNQKAFLQNHPFYPNQKTIAFYETEIKGKVYGIINQAKYIFHVENEF